MKKCQTKLGIRYLADHGSELGQRDRPRSVARHKLAEPVRQFLVHSNLPIPRQQTKISKQRSIQKMLFRQDVIFPALLPCISSGDRQFSLDNRPIQL